MSASCSTSSSAVPQIKYDVFLSFSGTDTRCGFLSHLRKALSQKKIEAYVDDRLEIGQEISAALLTAIEQSEISLVIFSPSYASSRWCLDELVQITDCMQSNGQIVLPVFYNIDPSEVRNQKGIYGDALAEHERNFKQNMDKVQNWRSVMNKVANLSGFHFHPSNFRTEAELIEKLVEHVLIRLNHKYQSDLGGLVGIDEKISDVELLLCNGSEDVRIVGIWGTGGIGKTTIASALFDRLCSNFEGCCFLANVREQSEKCGIAHLCNKVLSTLLEERDLDVALPNALPAYVRRRLRRRKVLVVLDDVNDLEQLRDLCGGHDWFGPGSRIVVTTRDKHVLVREANDTYEVKELDFGESLQLFNWNAFKHSCLGEGYSDLSYKAVHYAKGIPLALIILGSYLYGKNKKEWESELEKLKNFPRKKIQSVWRWSYNGLDRHEQNIVLHIACFFKGDTKEHIEVLLDACDYSTTIGLKTLQDRALIMVFKNCVSMHNLIQEMGWEIVREESIKDPGKRSRLWDPKDIHHVLKYNTATDTIESMVLDMSQIKYVQLSPQTFSKMPRLRLLNFYMPSYNEKCNVYLSRGLESLPDELIYFRWDCFPLKSLPPSFCVEKLVELDLVQSDIEKLWEGVPDLVNLKTLSLSDCKQLIDFPDLSKATNLSHLVVYGCEKLKNLLNNFCAKKLVKLDVADCGIEKLWDGVQDLVNLKTLSLSDCKQLIDLPDLSKATNLSHLFVYGHEKLKNLLNNFCAEKLVGLDVEDCGIEKLWDGVQDLVNLKTLSLRGCKQLIDLPDLSKATNLSHLDVYRCEKLKNLLNNFCANKLVKLDVADCGIEKLWDGVQDLVNLKTLSLSDCQQLIDLPDLSKATNLSHLFVYGCEKLKNLLNNFCAEKLVGLDVANCGIKKLWDGVQDLVNLKTLSLSDCKQLIVLPDLSKATNLSHLVVYGCKILKYLLNNFCAEKLVELDVEDCGIEKLWDGVQDLVNLNTLSLRGCKQLIDLPDLSKATNLSHLFVYGCEKLKNLLNSFCAEKLVELYVRDCGIKTLWDGVQDLVNLESLYLSHCNLLTDLPNLSKAANLSHLSVHGCERLKNLLNNFCAEKLVELHLEDCGVEKLWVRVQNLVKLREIKLAASKHLFELPNLSRASNLERVDLSGSKMLRELHTMPSFESLTELDLSRTNIESLPTTIKHFSRLQDFHLRSCKRLRSLPKLPPSVEILDASDCICLETVLGWSVRPESNNYYRRVFLFENCVKLNEQVVERIKSNARIRMEQAAYVRQLKQEKPCGFGRMVVRLPGSKLPEWDGLIRTTEEQLQITIASAPNLMGFICCCVSPGQGLTDYVAWACDFETSNGKIIKRLSYPVCGKPCGPTIVLYHDLAFCVIIADEIRKSGANKPRLSFQCSRFVYRSYETRGEAAKIEEWGILPVYASDILTSRHLELDANTTRITSCS